jgi:hypothetical protein
MPRAGETPDAGPSEHPRDDQQTAVRASDTSLEAAPRTGRRPDPAGDSPAHSRRGGSGLRANPREGGPSLLRSNGHASRRPIGTACGGEQLRSGTSLRRYHVLQGAPFEATQAEERLAGAGTRPHPTRERWLARGPRRQGRGKSILAPALRHQLSSQPPGVGGQASRLVVEARAAVGRACSRLSRRPGSQQGQSRGDLPPTPTPGCGWLPQFSNSSATSGRVATADSPRPRRHRSQATVSNSSPPPHPRTGCPMTCP